MPRPKTFAYRSAAPILDHLELPTSTQQLKGELGDPYDIWSQPPSPEIDRAWNELNDDNLAYVTSKDILAAGKNLSVAVKFPSDAGFGDDAYPILVDVKHKIHCLNRIRKDLYFDHYWASAYPDGETTDLHKDHTNHCVSILLKSLMCEASTDFITYAWYDGYDHPHPDFNIERKCGDFTGVNDWTAARSLDGDEFFNLPKPAGQVTLSMTDEALRALGQQDG